MNERMRIQRKREKATAIPSVQSETFQGDPTRPEHTVNEVPSIVQEVLSSSGQPLDAASREFMEPRLGHDFSQVRVHTDERAVESAQVVNALAYTVGQDVVFGEGQYAPGTSEGKRLLAHELTHVVQQEPGSMGNTAASAISKPNASHEIEAEQTSQAIVSDLILGPVLTSQLHAADPSTIYRKFEQIPVSGWGSALWGNDSYMWFSPHTELIIGTQIEQASFFLDNSHQTSFNASPGSSGIVRIYVAMGWHQENMFLNIGGWADLAMDLPFTVTPQGNVQWEEQRVFTNSGGEGAQLVLPTPVKGANAQGGFVTISPIILSAGSTSMNFGVNAGPNVQSGKDSLGVGGGFGVSESTPKVTQIQQSFTVDLFVPKPTTVQDMNVTDAHFQPASAKLQEGQEGQEREIWDWYRSLPRETQKSIEAGATEIRLEGHASTTQPGPANRKLSEERVKTVQAILRDFAGSQARFNTFAYGEYEARTPDNVEDEDERYVQMSVTTIQVQPPGVGPARTP